MVLRTPSRRERETAEGETKVTATVSFDEPIDGLLAALVQRQKIDDDLSRSGK